GTQYRLQRACSFAVALLHSANGSRRWASCGMLRRMLPYRLVPHNGRRVFRRRASRPVLVVCFAFGVVVGSSCSKTEPPETVAPGQATTALNDVVDSLTRTLAAPVPSAPTPCDDAVLRGKLGASAAKVLLAPRQQLSAWVLGDKPAANDAEFLNTRLLEGISLRVSSEEQAIIELTKFRELQEKRPFLGVLELDEWRSPAVDGVAFKGGEVSGTLS